MDKRNRVNPPIFSFEYYSSLKGGEKDCSIIFQSSNLETWRPLPSRERSWRDLREQGALHLAETLGWSITRDNRGRGRKGGGGLRLHFILALTNCYLNCISELWRGHGCLRRLPRNNIVVIFRGRNKQSFLPSRHRKVQRFKAIIKTPIGKDRRRLMVSFQEVIWIRFRESQ